LRGAETPVAIFFIYFYHRPKMEPHWRKFSILSREVEQVLMMNSHDQLCISGSQRLCR